MSLTKRDFPTESGTIPARTLGLSISRWISGGMHEDLDVTNNSMNPIKFQLEIAIRIDFADIFEVKSNRIVRRGRISTEWSPAQQRLRTTYRNRDFSRAVTITASRTSGEATYANGRLSFEVALQAGEAWHSCILYTLEDGNRHFDPPRHCNGHCKESEHADRLAESQH